MEIVTPVPAMLRRKEILILAAATALFVAFYLIVSSLYLHIGFPLDDAWIHQTYARSLAQSGTWAFTPGQASAGSTSPFWTLLLAVGHFLGLGPYPWTFFVGGLTLFALALTGELWVRQLAPTYRPALPWVGIFLAGEWHLLWAAVSGMETMLHALVITLGLYLALRMPRDPFWAGLLVGVSVWVRPDGVTLFGPLFFVLLFEKTPWREKWPAVWRIWLGFGLLFLPYLLFNLSLAETWFPNTMYAKQAEYAELQSIPFLTRYLRLLLTPLTGAGLLLAPAALFGLFDAARQRNWGLIASALWFFGYLGIYAARLPVVYQHGRYLIPAMPVFFLWGLTVGVAWLQRKLPKNLRLGRAAWQMAVVLSWLIFLAFGARAFAQDVAIIETEMVTVARWVDVNLPPEALIAAHDIGALGYFDHHQLLDLAGLISPDVIPFIRDQPALRQYLTEKGADYLIVFPGWYPELTAGQTPIFSADSELTRALGGENLAVYRWNP